MTEEKFRKYVIILLAIFVVGSLVIGSRMAQNGRYVQYDDRKFVSGAPTEVIDTRTGEADSR